MNILGIDPSLNATGVVILNFIDDNEKDFEIVKSDLIKCTPKMGDLGRLSFINDQIINIISDNEIENIAMEGLSFGARGRAMLQLAGLNYILQLSFKKLDVNYEIIPPTVMKKFVVGKGNAPKDQVMLKAFRKWKVDFDDNNICDAFCHAMYYRHYFYQQEKIK